MWKIKNKQCTINVSGSGCPGHLQEVPDQDGQGCRLPQGCGGQTVYY